MSDSPEPQGQSKLRLLVPTNFSVKSEMALQFALTYSQRQAAEIFLFHCYDQRATDFSQLDKINVQLVERMKASVMGAIEGTTQRGEQHHVEQVHRRVSYGKPGVEILKMAGGMSADMVIMGWPTSSGLKRVIDKAPCTVVLVKAKDVAFVMD